MRYGQLVNTRHGVGFVVCPPQSDDKGAVVQTVSGLNYLRPDEAARTEPLTAQCIDGFFTFASSPAVDTYGHR